ncbi:hypothetical protein [Acinetobacter chinensis]|uniref:hypothetical protein n=1 Tax=Acinetobacter chinensis TaxID=2004650 RepID=UPI0029349D53|nr:hypothetical protein [Acinetobacter chinensis]WOE42017.1 hypothetical protein QSG87_02395 [Acinetobacter chinensis]
MNPKAVLLDLENNMPTAKLLREIIEHFPVLYLFNCKGNFEYTLEDMTEFSGWVSSGQVVILDVPEASQKEFEYAVLVGQLMALLEPDSHVEVISAQSGIDVLMDLLGGADISCSLIQISSDTGRAVYVLPDAETFKKKPLLQQVKKYCDALGRMTGKPNTVEKLKNSIANILQMVPEKTQQVVGAMINLKIIKRHEDQIAYRKKILRQWIQLNLNGSPVPPEHSVDLSTAVTQLQITAESSPNLKTDIIEAASQDVQTELYKNFGQIDPVQLEVVRKLSQLKNEKPRDIYQLRDLLGAMFPQSDVRLLLKELIEKGYIYWNGHEILYSHEMYLN